MIQRFEKLTIGVTRIYKTIQKIKKTEMSTLGLKGTHVMCIYYLSQCADGLTAADLCNMCVEDKASISRILSELQTKGLIHYELPQNEKKYRARAKLTEAGRQAAAEVEALILRAVSVGGEGLTGDERDVFYQTLFQIAENLEKAFGELNHQ